MLSAEDSGDGGDSFMMIRLLIALLLFAAVPATVTVMAAEDKGPVGAAPQVRDVLLEQLQTQAREAEARASEAGRRERDAEIKRLADQAREAQAGLGQAEQRAREAELRQAVLQVKSDLQDNAYARLEILIGAFGALITVVVIFFAWNTRESAIAAAKSGVEDIRGKLEARLVEAETLVAKLRDHETDAGMIVRNLRPGTTPESKADQKTVADVAKLAAAKPPRDRSAEEYRAIIIDLFTRGKWPEMLTAAQQMRLLHEGDDDFGFARFNEAFALEQLERPEAIAAWDDVRAHYENSTVSGAKELAVSALVNKGSALGRLGRPMDSIAVSEEVIDLYGANDTPSLQRLAAFARINKGVALGQSGPPENEIAVYDDLIAHYDANKWPEMGDVVATAYFNKARAYARQGVVAETITTLQSMLGAGCLLNHQQVADVPDFDPIRNDPAFKKFLDENKGG